MKRTRKNLSAILMAAAIGCVIGGAATLTSVDQTPANASTAIEMDFSESVNSSWVAPANNYGWKTVGNKLKPDFSQAKSAQIGYLNQKIALNEAKYISFDFYAAEAGFDVGLLSVSEMDAGTWWTTNAVSVHCLYLSQWGTNSFQLTKALDGGEWLGDYTANVSTLIGTGHKLEIISDGTNLTVKIDGVQAYADIAIPANEVYLALRAGNGETTVDSWIDNLYIANSAPTASESNITDLSFETAATDLSFTAMAVDGWGVKNGVYAPKQEGGEFNASATKYDQVFDLTKDRYISFDFYSTGEHFDVGFLPTTAENIWGTALFSHIPDVNGNFSVSDNVDVGNWKGGVGVNYADGATHTMEITVKNGKVSFKIDGVTPELDTKATEFDIPANEAYLVFRAVGTDSYIDNLYIADSAPVTTNVVLNFDGGAYKLANVFSAWNSVGWTVRGGAYSPLSNWASISTVNALDLTNIQDISFDFCLSSSDTDKQFNVGFFADNTQTSEEGTGKNISVGATLFLGSSFTRNHWIVDKAANYYDDIEHNMKITFADGSMSVAIDSVTESILSTTVSDSAYMLMQLTSTASYVDNLTIKYKEAEATGYTVTVKDVAGETVDTVENVSGEYTLPERTGLLAYDVDGTLYPAGATIQLTENISIVEVTATFTTESGASVRMVESNPGLRFSSKISLAAYNYLKAKNAVVMGTLVAKADDVTDYSDLTTDFNGTHLNIVNSQEHEPKVADTENYNFNAAIVNIKPANYTAQFVARAYITVTYGEGSATFYTSGNGESRSVAYVANEAYNDRSKTQDETKFKYKVEGATEDKKYSPYTATQLGILADFAGIETASTAFVSPDGNDENNGVVTTKAVATVARALEIVEGQENATVYLLDGEYEVAETISLPSNVTLKSLNAGGAVLSGATVATGIVEKTDPELGRVWEIPCKKKPINCM